MGRRIYLRMRGIELGLELTQDAFFLFISCHAFSVRQWRHWTFESGNRRDALG
jgi:hypothetical protein